MMQDVWGILAATLFGLALLFVPSLARADTRIALVIGNGAYVHAPRLPNPVNDANDVAAALKRDGFETIVATDLNKSAMDEAAIRFAKAARDADVAVFYYSGHALQFTGINYLAPIDVNLNDETDLRRMVRLDDVIADLQQARNLRILVLDSCRDNPLAEQLRRSIGNSRAIPLQRGLAKIDAPRGMIVAYATQAGSTAEDGDGHNSPYTAALLKHIEQQEEIGTIFRRVSSDVYETTQHRQLPELSLSITGEFFLRGKLEITAKADGTAQPRSTPETNFKLDFHGVINPPASQTYRVIHDNVIVRAGPSELEDGLFRLRQQDEVQASAEYQIEDTLQDTWVKITTSNGQVGFLQRLHLLAPAQFSRWSSMRDRIGTLRTQFDRAQNQNSGPYARFAGVYCKLGECNEPIPAVMFVEMSNRFLIWFEGDKMHQVNLLSARDSVAKMTADGSLSFRNSKEPPFKGVTNASRFRVLFDNNQVAHLAFTKTNLFIAGDAAQPENYKAYWLAPIASEKERVLNRYMVDVADKYARIKNGSSIPYCEPNC